MKKYKIIDPISKNKNTFILYDDDNLKDSPIKDYKEEGNLLTFVEKKKFSTKAISWIYRGAGFITGALIAVLLCCFINKFPSGNGGKSTAENQKQYSNGNNAPNGGGKALSPANSTVVAGTKDSTDTTKHSKQQNTADNDTANGATDLSCQEKLENKAIEKENKTNKTHQKRDTAKENKHKSFTKRNDDKDTIPQEKEDDLSKRDTE